MEEAFLPHVGRWDLKGGLWRTAGEEPPGGWYLRSRRQYDIDRLAFRVRKEREDGFIYLYTTDWRVLLRPGQVSVKYAGLWGPGKPAKRHWTRYWYTVARDIRFPAGSWHDFELVLDGQYLTVRWDGREVVRWNSPAEEWTERVMSSGKVRQVDRYHYPERLPEKALSGRDQIVVLHTLHTPAAFKGLQLSGADRGEAQGFHRDGIAPAPYVRPDTDLQRLAPLEPVDVSWKLDDTEASKAAALPPVASWVVTEKEETGEAISSRDERLEYLVGAERPGTFPRVLFGPRGWPREARVYFNLEKSGPYTFKTEWESGLGWGSNVLEVLVDGRVVSREVYRALTRWSSCPVKDYIPLKLGRGPHRIDIRFGLELITDIYYVMKYMQIPMGAIALVPGLQEPVFEYKACSRPGPPHSDEALRDLPSKGEQYGKVVRYRITDLASDGPHRITLGFYEVDVQKPGQRLMDIFINGRRVEADLDAVNEAGWLTYLEKTYDAASRAAPDGRRSLDVKLVGGNFKAFLNYLKVEDPEGRIAFEENCGWSPDISKRYTPPTYHPDRGASPTSAEPPAWTPEAAFDGHNLVANPRFSLKDERGRPSWWYSGPEYREIARAEYPQSVLQRLDERLREELSGARSMPEPLAFYNLLAGSGEFTYEGMVGHEHPGSMRIERTDRDFGVVCNWPVVDYGKRQKFSFWAKTEGAAGRVFAEILWFAVDMNSDLKWRDFSLAGTPLPTPRLQLIGRTRGRKSLTGTHDWTQLEAEGVPPFGSCYAALAVRVEENSTGTVWVDDAEFNGYGAEPLEITYSFLGYHPRGDKQIVVKSLTKATVLWRLTEAGVGREVRSGEAKYHSYEWFSKRHYYQVNLTDFERSGSYVLEVRQGALAAATEPFAIDRDVYRRLCRIMLHGLYFKRFNTDIPGGHEPGAMEDSHAIPARQFPRHGAGYDMAFLDERKDILGGYYDAGDQMKHMEYWPAVLLATCALHRHVAPPLADRTANDALDELLWAYRAFHKVQSEDGSVYTRLYPYTEHTENIPLYGTDRYMSSILALPQTAGVAALGSLVLQGIDEELSQRYLQVARKNYEYNRLWERTLPAQAPDERLLCASKALFAEMYLFKLTGEETYGERTDRHARIVAEGLKAGAYRRTRELFHSSHNDACILQDFAWVPCQFLALCPDHPAAGDLKEGLRAFASHVGRVSSIPPWGQARDLTTPDDEEPLRFPGGVRYSRAAGYWPMLAYSLSQIGVVLRDPEIVRLAERQLQWCLGKNFADVSMVHGVGRRFVAGGDMISHQPEFFSAWLKSDRKLMYYDGSVPTMAFRDIGDGEVRTAGGDDYHPALQGYPKGYCYMYLQPDYPVHPGPTEYFLPQTAQFALAAAGVYAAMKSLEMKTPAPTE